MSSSRFIVIKLKDIIKTAVFVITAIALIFAAALFLSKTVSSESVYTPGT